MAGTKIAGSKRELEEEVEEVGDEAGKRQKVDEADTQVFRFLDLPGELQNRVYEFAMEDALNSFPSMTRRNNKSRRRRRSTRSTTDLANAAPQDSKESLPVPWIALTQVCAQIRADFRPLWMSCHRTPLEDIDRYFRVWFSQAPQKDRDRFNAYYSTEAKLSVSIHDLDKVANSDIIRLLKHKVRFPKYTIVLDSSAFINPGAVRGLEQVINNKHPRWVKWIKRCIVSHIRLEVRNNVNGDHMRIVVKEKYAMDWMKPTIGANTSALRHDVLASLGLDNVTYWILYFGVDYS